jgi:peptide deformylase
MSGPRILPIVECGDPVLRRPADPVDPSDLRTSEMQVLIARMRVTMEAAPGVGLQ